MAVKFPLKMADGTMVRTIEELREHFDLAATLAYYDNGRLAKWLENGYYDEEAKKVAALDANSVEFAKELCNILGVNYAEHDAGQMALDDISKGNVRLEHLKQYTVDDAILAMAEQVAFTQEELTDLLNRGVTDIYLCGNQFIIPEGFEDISYQCVNDPIVRFGKVERLEKAAEQGDTTAQLELGRYYEGRGDFNAAIEWYAQALNQGDDEALTTLDKFDNWLVSQRRGSEAVEWYTRAAEKGSVLAQIKLAECYWYGIGIKKDVYEAAKWYRSPAEQGNARAQLGLGRCYVSYAETDIYTCEEDDFVEQACADADLTEEGFEYGPFEYGRYGCYKAALKWYKRAAEQSYAKAQLELAECYNYGYCNVMTDKDEALRWYMLAVEQGDAEAQVKLGRAYENGQRDVYESNRGAIKEDKEKALKWYKKAAEQGYAKARTELGNCYKYGRCGVKVDGVEALRWYRVAIEQGDGEAQVELAECYKGGWFGVEKDEEKAIKLYKKAAEQKYVPAQMALGRYYDRAENYEEAAKWYQLAAEQGDTVAEVSLSRVLEKINPTVEYEEKSLGAKIGDLFLNAALFLDDLSGRL